MVKAENYAVVGHRVSRVKGYEKVSGEAKYVADIVIPGMLFGKVLRSPYPHARILNIDTHRAECLPGVRAIVSAEDTPKRPWGSFFKDQFPLAV